MLIVEQRKEEIFSCEVEKNEDKILKQEKKCLILCHETNKMVLGPIAHSVRATDS
jgi:hypothetical protein